MGFPRPEDWSGSPFPSPGALPNPGIEPVSPAWAGGFLTTDQPGKGITHTHTHTHSGILLSREKKNKTMCFAAAGMNPEIVTRRKSGKDKYHAAPLRCGI